MTFTRNVRRTFARASLVVGVVAAFATANNQPVQAFPLLDGLGGPAGFGELAMDRNDDGSSNALNLPFNINFFGNVLNTFFVNNNGNITFNNPDGTFTPDPFPVIGEPRIAPYWGDVDTGDDFGGCNTCGQVFVGSPNAQTTVVTWNNVGFFFENDSLTNNFQAVLRDRSADFSPGDFDIEFRYDRLEWTTGDASGGTNGLGGTPAQAGFDAGDGVNFFTIPGSRTAAVLDLQDTSNVSPTTPGLWSFAIRQGEVPGSTPDNPLLPIVNEEGFNFDFNVQLGQQIFIDPVIAVGYDYVVNSGPNVATILIPAALPNGDGEFTLDLGIFGTFDLFAGVLFDLLAIDPLGFSEFSILDISIAEALDPTDTLAFVTGLTFVDSGLVSLTQSPITIDTDSQGVPEPSSGLLVLAGLALLHTLRSRRRREAVNAA